MTKTFKIVLVAVFAIFVATCLFFCLAPQSDEQVTLTPAQNSLDYSQNIGAGYDLLLYDPKSNVADVQSSSLNFHFTEPTYIIDVYLVNLKDCRKFEEPNFNYWIQFFDGVSEYFKVQSKNYLDMKFNLHVTYLDRTVGQLHSIPADYMAEKELCDEAKKSKYACIQNNGYGQAQMLLVSSNMAKLFTSSDSVLWPHVWVTHNTLNRLCISTSQVNQVDICHEMVHMLGVRDLYTNNFKEFIGQTDILGCVDSLEYPTSAHIKKQLNWFSESDFGDGVKTDIEVITQTGTYVLDTSTTIGGISAYKFGQNGSQYFMVEQRNFDDGQQYLVVQRINTDYSRNTHVTSQEKTYIMTFGPTSLHWEVHSGLLSVGDAVGGKLNPLYYADETIAEFCINNIKILPNNQISFSFYTSSQNQTIEDTQPKTVEAFYIAVQDAKGQPTSVGQILVFNNTTKKYEDAKNLSLVYVGGLPYYRIDNMGANYTKCKISSTMYFVASTTEIALNQNQSKYLVILNPHFIHIAGHAVKSTIITVVDFFKYLF